MAIKSSRPGGSDSGLTPIGDRGQAVTESGERVIGRFTPTGKDASAVSRATTADLRAGTAQRKRWEASPEGQARTQGISVEKHGMTPGQYHFERTYGQKIVGPTHYDRQLPGMADPNAAPRPPRWDELSPAQQQAADRGARAFGTNLDTMTKDIGAQLDQAVLRAASYGHARGHTEDFYSTGKPRQVIDRSASELGIPKTIHAHMNAMTSPNTKFQATRSTGEIFYPNDEAARHAVRHVQIAGSDRGLTNNLGYTGQGVGRAQGYTTNIRKAATAFDQHTRGVSPADWITSKDGKGGPFDNSPKTGPYSNSWNDTHPQFTVADVHTGGGGAFPHLSSSKPVLKDEYGQDRMRGNMPIRDKSDREKALATVPHAHTMVDEAMRRAMAQRNMPSVREAQALQWGEEQIQRGLVRPENAYPTPQQNNHKSRSQMRGQLQMDLGAVQVEKSKGQQGWNF